MLFLLNCLSFCEPPVVSQRWFHDQEVPGLIPGQFDGLK